MTYALYEWLSGTQGFVVLVWCLNVIYFRLAAKVTIAGGALYVACDSGLLGSSEQGSQALQKAKAAVPPAVEEWMKYFGLEVHKKQLDMKMHKTKEESMILHICIPICVGK